MVDLQEISELRSIVPRVAGVHASIHRLGDPSVIAGDPTVLRGLAGSHRDAAGGLRAAVARAQTQSARTAGDGGWDGRAGGAFSGFWAGVRDQVDELAARHGQMAGALDAIAGRAEGLNREVAGAIAGIEAWLEAAIGAMASLDVGAVPPLLGAASTILSRWQVLLSDLEAFTSSLPLAMEGRLPAAWSPPGGGLLGPADCLVRGAPGAQGIMITAPLPPFEEGCSPSFDASRPGEPGARSARRGG